MSAVGRISHQTDRSRWSANVCECQTNPAFVTYFVFLLFLTFRNIFSHNHSATEKCGEIVKRGENENENDFDLDEKWQILGLVSNYLWSAIGFNPSSIHHRTVINLWLICHKCNLRNTHVFFSDNRVSWRCDRLVTISQNTIFNKIFSKKLSKASSPDCHQSLIDLSWMHSSEYACSWNGSRW